jgi:hypothetical protein
MKQNFLIYLLSILIVLPVKTNFIYEEIEELIPKTMVFDLYHDILIYKYHIPFNDDSKVGNFTLFISSIDEYLSLFIYDNYSIIADAEKGDFINYNSKIEKFTKKDIIFDNLTCDNDYYLVFQYPTTEFFEITILNNRNKTLNISPLLSDYFKIYPSNKEHLQCFYYFNETKYALINYEGLFLMKEDDKDIHQNFNKIFEFKANSNYSMDYYPSSSKEPLYLQFYDNPHIFKHNITKRPLVLLNNSNYEFEIDISKYEIGEYILFRIYDGNLNIKYTYNNIDDKSNYINLGTYQFSNFIPIKKTKNDSLILKIQYNDKTFTILDIFKYCKVKEITGDFDIYFENTTQLFIIDDYLLNYSFGIESNNRFAFYEQKLSSDIITSSLNFYNIFISKENFNSLDFSKRFFIYFYSNLSKKKIFKI